MNEMADASGIEYTLIQKALATHTPVNGSLELLPLCNMNCRMCYVRLDRERVEQLGGLRSVDQWLSLAREMKSAGTLFLLLTGGEPLLFPDFKRLYTELRQMGMIVTVNTNGTLIDEEWADFFAAHKPRRINITLYGSGRETYENLCGYGDGFDKTVNAISMLKERGVDVKLNYSAVARNTEDLESVFGLADNLGVPINVDSYMYPSTRERENEYDFGQRLSPEDAAKVWLMNVKHSFSEDEYNGYVGSLLDMVERQRSSEHTAFSTGLTCMASNCSFTINWQGQMRPCVMLSEPSVNVFEKGFMPSWNLLREKAQYLKINEKCVTCEYRPLCRICAASALGETGKADKIPKYLCEMAEACYRLIQEK